MVHCCIAALLRRPSIVWDKETRLRLQLFDTPTIVFVLSQPHTADPPTQEDHTYRLHHFH